MSAFASFAAAVQTHAPATAVVLGSGLGAVPHLFTEIASIGFADVPGLTVPSVHGHSGTISLGICGQRPMLVFRGRLHFYEGHSWAHVAAPIHVAAKLGIKWLLLTNAAGGIHESLMPGDLLALRAHLFLQRPTPVRQMTNVVAPYSQRLIELLRSIERERHRELLAGVYAALTGPCYETPAEIRALQTMGADAVGMSTAFEAETAAELGIEVAAISCITNKAAGLSAGTLDHREVLANALKTADRLSEILVAFQERVGPVDQRGS